MIVYDSTHDEVDYIKYDIEITNVSNDDLSEDDIFAMKYVNKYITYEEILLN